MHWGLPALLTPAAAHVVGKPLTEVVLCPMIAHSTVMTLRVLHLCMLERKTVFLGQVAN
jgi:hypothetical protein